MDGPLVKKLGVIRVLLCLISLIPSTYYYMLQVEEDEVVNDYLKENDLLDLPHALESAIKVSDALRMDFNTDANSFKSLHHQNRPFLRETASYLLTHKEGECGEGTRVLVVLLNRMGYDATRLTLYNKILDPSHTLISLLIDNQEYLLDSINSTQEINTFLKENKISTSSFKFENLAEREMANRAKHKDSISEGERLFFKKYWLYSYESKPFTKIFAKLGFNIRAFNLERPPVWISSLAEKPCLIMSFFYLVISVLFISLLFTLKLLVPNAKADTLSTQTRKQCPP